MTNYFLTLMTTSSSCWCLFGTCSFICQGIFSPAGGSEGTIRFLRQAAIHGRRRAKQFGGRKNLPECSKQNISKCVVCSPKKQSSLRFFPFFLVGLVLSLKKGLRFLIFSRFFFMGGGSPPPPPASYAYVAICYYSLYLSSNSCHVVLLQCTWKKCNVARMTT